MPPPINNLLFSLLFLTQIKLDAGDGEFKFDQKKLTLVYVPRISGGEGTHSRIQIMDKGSYAPRSHTGCPSVLFYALLCICDSIFEIMVPRRASYWQTVPINATNSWCLVCHTSFRLDVHLPWRCVYTMTSAQACNRRAFVPLLLSSLQCEYTWTW